VLYWTDDTDLQTRQLVVIDPSFPHRTYGATFTGNVA
jgi:hypothetical protein